VSAKPVGECCPGQTRKVLPVGGVNVGDLSTTIELALFLAL
jgi:hypothetical protein